MRPVDPISNVAEYFLPEIVHALLKLRIFQSQSQPVQTKHKTLNKSPHRYRTRGPGFHLRLYRRAQVQINADEAVSQQKK